MIFIKVVVLAGGFGTRIGEISKNKQKTMIEINGKPILEILLNKIVESGIKDIIIVVGYKKEQIINYFGNGRKIHANISYIIDDETGSGTALSLLKAEDHVKNLFLVVNGDTLFEDNLKKIIQRKSPTITVTECEDVSNYGLVNIKNGNLVDIKEKEGTGNGLVNAGIYLFDERIFDAIRLTKKSKRGEYELTDSIMISKNKFGVKYRIKKINGHWVNIGTPEDLKKARELFGSNI